MMSYKSLLLDIDGVLVRDTRLQNKISSRCAKYTASKLPDVDDPVGLTQSLYLQYGHTALGLQKCFGIDTSDFNDAVYTKDVLIDLQKFLKSDIFVNDAEYIKDFIYRGWEVNLFSNTPDSYQWRVASAIHDLVGCSPIGTSGSNRKLKPDPLAYTYFPTHKTHVFVDDSSLNLKVAQNLPNWYPIHFCPNQCEIGFPSISSILDLSNLISEIDDTIDPVRSSSIKNKC